jgi:hypothetical protein
MIMHRGGGGGGGSTSKKLAPTSSLGTSLPWTATTYEFEKSPSSSRGFRGASWASGNTWATALECLTKRSFSSFVSSSSLASCACRLRAMVLFMRWKEPDIHTGDLKHYTVCAGGGRSSEISEYDVLRPRCRAPGASGGALVDGDRAPAAPSLFAAMAPHLQGVGYGSRRSTRCSHNHPTNN